MIRKWCFEIFDLREFGVIECFCTSSVPNLDRPKAQLKEHTIDKDFKLNHIQWFSIKISTEEVQKSSASNHC